MFASQPAGPKPRTGAFERESKIEIIEAEEERRVRSTGFAQRRDPIVRTCAAGKIGDRFRCGAVRSAKAAATFESCPPQTNATQARVLARQLGSDTAKGFEGVMAWGWIVIVEQDKPIVFMLTLKDGGNTRGDPASGARVAVHAEVLDRSSRRRVRLNDRTDTGVVVVVDYQKGRERAGLFDESTQMIGQRLGPTKGDQHTMSA